MLWRRILLSALVIFNLFLLYNLVWSENGIFAYLDLKSRHTALVKQREALEEKSLDLSQEIRWLKTDRAYTEKMSRAQMNYLKDNEILYQFPRDAAGGKEGPSPDDRKN
jgi:cell division protein FtsB/cell division protein DivIC